MEMTNDSDERGKTEIQKEGKCQCLFALWHYLINCKEDFEDFLLLIYFAVCVHRSGSRSRPSGLWEPRILLAFCPRHTHLELRRTHLCGRPGMYLDPECVELYMKP